QIGPSHVFVVYSAKTTYIAGLIIAASFYLFSIAFPEESLPTKSIIFTVYGLIFAYSIFLLTLPGFLVQSVVPQGSGNAAILEPVGYLTFTGIFCFLYIGGLIRIGHKYFNSAGIIRSRLLIIGLGVAITGMGGFYYDIILASPFINEFQYIWTGPLFNTITAVLIVYAVFRLGFLNTKVIVTELLISLLWIFTFLRTLLASDQREQTLNGALFLFALVIGSLLIRSVRREVLQRELIEKQEKELQTANDRLKELDHMKDEFLSIASHQLRAPITAVRGYASLILEG